MSDDGGATTIGDLLGLLEVYPRDATVSFGDGDLFRFMGLKLKGPRRVQVELAETGSHARRVPSGSEAPVGREGAAVAADPQPAQVDDASVARRRRVKDAVREWLILTHASAEAPRGDLVAQLALKFDVSEAEIQEGIPKAWRTQDSTAARPNASRPGTSGRD